MNLGRIKRTIKRNAISIGTFFITTFLLSIAMNIVGLHTLNQMLVSTRLTENLHDDYVYCFNDTGEDVHYEDKSLNSYYRFEETLFNEEHVECEVINENALTTGLLIPCSNTNDTYYLPFNRTDIPRDTYLTNNKALANKYNITYSNYFKRKKVTNFYFGSFYLDCELIYIDSDFDVNNFDGAVYPFPYEGFDTDSYSHEPFNIFVTGKTYKYWILDLRKNVMTIFTSLAIIPYAFMNVALFANIRHYINLKKDDIIIEHVFYKKKSKIKWLSFLETFLMTFIFSLLGLFIAYLLVGDGYLGNLLCFMGVSFITTIIAIPIIISISIDEFLKKGLVNNLYD